MTSTRIIAADGTRYFPEGTDRRLIKRIILAALAFIALIIASAAVIGFSQATPAAAKTDNQVESFNDGWNTGITDIQDLARKVGKIKVADCLTSTHTPDDFYTCLGH